MKIALLGSTGSIGRSTLDVIDAHPDELTVVTLAAGRNIALLEAQIARYRPALVSVEHAADAAALTRTVGTGILSGDAGLMAAATHPDVDMVIVATSGHASIAPTIAALRAGKQVAMANKETIVCAGELVMAAAAHAGTVIRPVDSEHSAIWQCLQTAGAGAQPSRIILTASGGPFRTRTADDLRTVTAADALRHPTWDMGAKITIDSASLMNKGLETIEAHWLFAMPYAQIEVIVNPQSIVHSYIEYEDGSLIAQLGPADMRLPIQYALSYPARWANPFRRADLPAVGTLHFEMPDEVRFPCLRIAREAGEAGNTYPTVLSAADEIAVGRFIAGEIGFMDIPVLVQTALDAHTPDGTLSLESIMGADRWTREWMRQ